MHWEKHGPAFAESAGETEKDSAGAVVCKLSVERLVAEKIGGKYWMYWGSPAICVATSDDLIRWTPVKSASGEATIVLPPRRAQFDSQSVTPGPPALLTERGVVLLYHGETNEPGASGLASNSRSVGLALFDAGSPGKLLHRSGQPILKPELPYEAVGQSGAGTTAATGLVYFKSHWFLYYGASGNRTAVAIADPSGKPVNPPLVRKPKRTTGPVALTPDDAGSLNLRSGWELIDGPSVNAGAETISAPGLDTRQWFDAIVPGTVLTTLVEQGVEPEPFHGVNNLRISEKYCRQAYWYRNAFTLPSAVRNRRLELGFDGINYAAEIWLNGHKLGEMKGAFSRGRFDVTDAVRFDGPNVLAVRILPQPHPGVPDEQSLATGAGPNGGIAMADGPTFGCSMGWDWIPGIRDRCAGIWRDVTIRCGGPVQIGDLQVITTVPSLACAEVSIKVPVVNRSGGKQKGTLRGRLGNVVFEEPVSLDAGGSKSIDFNPGSKPQLRIAEPRLWWPNGYGKPELYDLELTFTGADGMVSDLRRLRVGLREMSYGFSRDSAMEMIVKVNGQRIFCRGGNWGMDDGLKRLEPERVDAWVRMHRDASLNMIRNWVAQSTSEEFYRRCDQYGILVWNDLALANPSDGPEPNDKGLFIEGAKETVLRFRNHPCIALWCARNESVPSPGFADQIYQEVWNLDSSRLFLPDSASYGVSGRGPYTTQPSEHYFNMARGMKSEMGLVCVPTSDAVRAMLDKPDLWPINDAWAYHDFCRVGAMRVDGYIHEITQRYGAPRDLDDFCRKAQALNYESHRAAFEGWGQRMWRGSSGLLLWMTHCSWPSTVWQLYSYDLEPTAALFGTQKACEPVHIQMDPRDGTVTMVNLSLTPIAGATAEATIYDLNGKQLHSQSVPAEAGANSVADCFKLTDSAGGARFVSLVLRSGQGKELSRNFYWFAKRPVDLQGLNEMPKVALGVSAKREAGGDHGIIVQLRNPTPNIAFMAKLTLRDRSGRRILPVFYGENYLSLTPGETRTIRIDSAANKKTGDAVVEIDGWNVSKATLPVE